MCSQSRLSSCFVMQQKTINSVTQRLTMMATQESMFIQLMEDLDMANGLYLYTAAKSVV